MNRNVETEAMKIMLYARLWITPSPVADYLYVALGEARLMKGVVEARTMWDATISPRMFLTLQPREPMLIIAKAVGEMAPTRAAALHELMKLL